MSVVKSNRKIYILYQFIWLLKYENMRLQEPVTFCHWNTRFIFIFSTVTNKSVFISFQKCMVNMQN